MLFASAYECEKLDHFVMRNHSGKSTFIVDAITTWGDNLQGLSSIWKIGKYSNLAYKFIIAKKRLEMELIRQQAGVDAKTLPPCSEDEAFHSNSLERSTQHWGRSLVLLWIVSTAHSISIQEDVGDSAKQSLQHH
ncbi:hypothetical protein CEXT_318571 [Caerostris extrusa]|uniref:Uncharacterized protein n=1 Tax=Caerostris extrusa TaxID=172846 RepID=A0AAV4W0S1_CAEEX|nr:hypothetical protein CEXT_318571 [Caerostris extrusa]